MMIRILSAAVEITVTIKAVNQTLMIIIAVIIAVMTIVIVGS